MNWLQRTCLLLLLALWVPATQHCRLEVLPGFEFLSCCRHAQDAQAPAHHDQDCADDGCAAFESGLYQQEDTQVAVVTPLAPLLLFLAPPANQDPPSLPLVSAAAALSPPELAGTWHFSSRAALPARAPCVLS
jgi:hypothetical protein